MAQIGSVYQTETTAQTHTGSTTFTTKFTVLGSAFDDSTEYIMWVRAQISGSTNNGLFKFQTQIGSSTPEGSLAVLEPQAIAATSTQTYIFFHKFTTAATAEAVTFQIAPLTDIALTAQADSITLLALKLADLDSADWVFAEDTTDGDHTTGSTWGDEASITFTPANADDDWLIVAWGQVIVNNQGKNWRYRINESVSGELEPLTSREGEDAVEETQWMLCRPYTLTAAEHVIKIQSNDDSSSGTENKHNISKIFALRLNAFEQHAILWDGGTFDTTGTVFAEIADLAFTPDTTGNGVCIGTAMLSSTGTFQIGNVRMQLAGTTIPTGSDSNSDSRSQDATDILCIPVVTRFSVTGASAADVDIDGKTSDTDADFVDRGFAAWSLELAAAGGGVDIAVPLGTFVFAGLIPSVETGVNIDSPLKTYAFTGFLPTIDIGVNVVVPLGTFVFAGLIPTIETGVTVDVLLHTYSFAGLIPSIETGANIDLPLQTYVFAGFIPTVNTPDVQVPLHTFVFSGLIPSVFTGVNVSVPLQTFDFVGLIPTIETTVNVLLPLQTFSFLGLIPTIDISVAEEIILRFGELIEDEVWAGEREVTIGKQIHWLYPHTHPKFKPIRLGKWKL